MLSFITSKFFNSQKYRIFARFRGTLGPLNCLSFTRDGRLLASGADDQALRIWDVQGKRHLQTLEDRSGRWGQITCIKWLSISPAEGRNILCFGTGRGLLLIYQGLGGKVLGNYREMSSTEVFPLDDPIESLDFDRNKCRLAITSHNGKIKMYSVDKNGFLISIWEKCMSAPCIGARCATPTSVRFTAKGEHLLVFGLETGTMDSRVSATGTTSWSKTLSSSIGRACFNSGENLLLIDNLTDGFDLYKYPHTSPFRSLDLLPRGKSYVLGGIFLENGIYVACGSDHGNIYLFSVEKGPSIQKLRHGSRQSMIQTLDKAVSTNEYHLIASGTNDDCPDVIIWEKTTDFSSTARNTCRVHVNFTAVLMVCNFLLIIVALGLDAKQMEAIMTVLQHRIFGFSRHRLVYKPPPYDQSLKEKARLAMENSRTLLLQRGINLDDPDSLSTYLKDT